MNKSLPDYRQEQAVVVYDDKLKASWGMKAFWSSIAVGGFCGGLACYLTGTPVVYAICWGITGFFVLMALAFTPKRLIVYRDRVAIKLYLGYTVTISAAKLKVIRKLPKSNVYLSQDIPFKSSWSTPVHIVQKKGLAFVVTPSDPDDFVAQVTRIAPERLGNM